MPQTAALNRWILDSATDFAIIATDLTGRVTSWNAGAEQILGWTESEMVGHSAERIFTPDDVEADRPNVEMRCALQTGAGSDERWHIRKGGEWFWANGQMTVLRDDNDQALGFVKVLRDRTSQHIAAQALEEAQARLGRAQVAGGVGLFTVEMADDILIPTAEFCRIYGIPVQAQYAASEIEARIIREDRHLVSSSASRGRAETEREVEYRVRFDDTNELRWIARTGEFEFDVDGRSRNRSHEGTSGGRA